MSAARCDSCGKRIRAGHHEARLLDAQTGQRIGAYHAACQGAAACGGGGVADEEPAQEDQQEQENGGQEDDEQEDD